MPLFSLRFGRGRWLLYGFANLGLHALATTMAWGLAVQVRDRSGLTDVPACWTLPARNIVPLDDRHTVSLLAHRPAAPMPGLPRSPGAALDRRCAGPGAVQSGHHGIRLRTRSRSAGGEPLVPAVPAPGITAANVTSTSSPHASSALQPSGSAPTLRRLPQRTSGSRSSCGSRSIFASRPESETASDTSSRRRHSSCLRRQ